MKTKFRIVEYKDHFRIQKKYTEDTYFSILDIELWKNGVKEVWCTVIKDRYTLNVYYFSEPEKYQFKTKEECLEWIEDYNKYPIYHNVI